MKPRLAIDQDQVIADLLTEWVNRYNKDYDDNLKKEDITEWNFCKLVKPQCGKKIYNYLDDENLFLNLKPIEGSIETIKKLSESYEIFIVTAPWNINNVIPKYVWLKKYLPFIDEKNYVFTRNKSIINADYLIDDKPSNLENFRGVGMLYDAPHNKSENRFKRVHNWLEIEEFLL